MDDKENKDYMKSYQESLDRLAKSIEELKVKVDEFLELVRETHYRRR